jgi:hypothetical protein
MSVGDVSVPHIALQLGSRRSFSSPVVCEPGFRPALTRPCDRGRFHAEPVKDICTRRPGAPAVVGYPPRAFCDLATWPPRSASRRPVTHCDLSHWASSPSPFVEHEPLETSSNEGFFESRRRPPTSAVRHSSRARSRALVPAEHSHAQQRRVPKHAPAETTRDPKVRAPSRASMVTASRSRESGFAPRAATHGLGLAFIAAPRRETTSTRPDAFRYLEPRSDVAFAKHSHGSRLVEWLAPPRMDFSIHIDRLHDESWQVGRPTRTRLLCRALNVCPDGAYLRARLGGAGRGCRDPHHRALTAAPR